VKKTRHKDPLQERQGRDHIFRVEETRPAPEKRNFKWSSREKKRAPLRLWMVLFKKEKKKGRGKRDSIYPFLNPLDQRKRYPISSDRPLLGADVMLREKDHLKKRRPAFRRRKRGNPRENPLIRKEGGLRLLQKFLSNRHESDQSIYDAQGPEKGGGREVNLRAKKKNVLRVV